MVSNCPPQVESKSAIKYLIFSALLIVPLAFFHPAYNSIKGVTLLFFVFFSLLIFAVKGLNFIRSDWLRILPFVFFCLSGPVSVLGNSNWFRGLEIISLEFAFLGFYLIAGRILADQSSREKAAFLAIIPAGIIAGVGILQWFRVLPVPLDRYGEEDLASLFGISNYASDYLAVIIPLAFGGLLLGNVKKTPALIVTLLGLIYVILCRNRTAWVALGFSFLVCAVLIAGRIISRKISLKWSDPRVASILVILIGVFLVISFSGLGNSVLSRMRSVAHFQEASVAYRINLWEACFKLFREHPVRGVGVGNLETSVPEVWNQDLENTVVSNGLATQKAHNFYLQVLAERGLLGALGLLWILFSVGYSLRQGFRSAKNDGEFFWLLGITGGLLGGLVGSIFSFGLQSPASGMAFWFLAALISRFPRGEIKVQPEVATRILPWVFVLAAGFPLFWYGRFSLAGIYELKGLEALVRNQKDQAREEYSRALRIYPYLPLSLERRAEIQLEAGGRLDPVIGDLKKSLEILPNQVSTRELLARVFARQGRYQDAVLELEKTLALLKSAQQRRDVLSRLTGYALLGGDLSQSLDYGRKAVALNPGDASAHFYLGLAGFFSGQPDPARVELEEAVRLDPNSAWSWYYLGSVYFKLGREEPGKRAWSRAQALDPGIKKYTDRNHPQNPDWLLLK